MRTHPKFMLLALAMAVSACGSSSAKSTATSSPGVTPSAAVSVLPALSVTGTAEDYTGKPAPAGAVVMTMAALMFNPALPAGTGTKIVIYIDNKDPDKNDCVGNAAGQNICHQHALLVLGPAGVTLGKTDTVLPGHQAVLTLDGMRPGSYKFNCPLYDHSITGMTGLLKVS